MIDLSKIRSSSKLADHAELTDSVRILKQRIAAANAGEKGIPAEHVLAELKKRMVRVRK
jgi:hypothetical protein